MSGPIVGAYSDLGLGLLEVFGLEGRMVKRLTLDIPCDGLVTLIVEEYVTKEQADDAVLLASRYNLVPEEPGCQDDKSDDEMRVH